MTVIFEEELGLLSQDVKEAGIHFLPVPGSVLSLEKLLWKRKLLLEICLESYELPGPELPVESFGPIS